MNQTTTNPFQIDELQKYASLKNMFLDSLRALEQQGIIHSLVIDKEFNENQDIQKLSCLPYETSEASAFARAMPYCPIYKNKNIPLVSCQLTGIKDFSIMLGVALDAGEFCNASYEMGISICSKYGDQIYDNLYSSNEDIGHGHEGVSSIYYDVSHSFVDFRMILDNARHLQKEKAE